MKLYLLALLCISNFVIAGDDDDNYSLCLDKWYDFEAMLQFFGPTILNITSNESMDVSIEDGYITQKYINITNYSQYYEIGCNHYSHVIATITSNANNNNITISRTQFIGCSWLDINRGYLIAILVILGICCCLCVMTCVSIACSRKHRSDPERIPLL